MIYRRSLLIASVALLGLAAASSAQVPAVKEDKPGLLAKAGITP